MIELINANSIAIPLASQSVHLIVTSPPYFGLRSYQAGDGEIGAEPTPEEFIAALVAVGRECWRVLRGDGVMVVNLGDSYATQRNDHLRGGWGDNSVDEHSQVAKRGKFVPDGLQTGDRMNIPHRVAAALQADGWLWRDTVIWRKKSAMPESVNGWRWERCRVKVGNSQRGNGYKSEAYGERPMNAVIGKDFAPPSGWQDCPGCDKCADTDGLVLRRGSWRTTSAHEYIFVFAKGMGYFADREAVKACGKGKPSGNVARKDNHQANGSAFATNVPYDGTGGANPRNVMTFKQTPFKGAHYATFPTTLPEWFIRAFTPERCCAVCGAAWARVVESDAFRRTCDHAAAPTRPAIVLDPFAGSGSTLIAARQLGRSGIGLDLNLRYILDVARERLGLNAVSAWANGKAKGGETKVEDLPMFS